MKRVRFKNPPIMEAIIGLTITQLPVEVLDIFRGAAARLSELGYTKIVPVTQHQVQFKIERGKLSSSSDADEEIGTQFISENGRYVAQFKRDGFVFNQVGEYSTWEEFTAEGKKLWAEFLRLSSTVETQSFQVRYINKLFTPNGQPTEMYIRVYPHLPPDMPQEVVDSFMRISLPIADPVGSLTHQQILLPPEREGFQTLMFDNDFRFPAFQIPLGRIWEHIDAIRDVKDRYFLGFLTDAMKESFNA